MQRRSGGNGAQGMNEDAKCRAVNGEAQKQDGFVHVSGAVLSERRVMRTHCVNQFGN